MPRGTLLSKHVYAICTDPKKKQNRNKDKNNNKSRAYVYASILALVTNVFVFFIGYADQAAHVYNQGRC